MISRPESEGQFTQDPSHGKVVHNLLFQGYGGWGGEWGGGGMGQRITTA